MPTGQEILSLFILLNILMYEVFRNLGKNCIKTFCHFRCQFEIHFIQKTAIIPSEKPTGQQIFSSLNVFNNLIHEVYQKLDKIA